jgi:hypothetical protein
MVGEIGGSGLLGSREYDLSAGSDPRCVEASALGDVINRVID